MVAILGAIMPEPLAMPAIETSTPPIRAVSVAPLGKVSVVQIAWAAAFQALGSTPATRLGNAAVSLAMGKRSPMTPVADTMTSVVRQPSNSAVFFAVAATSRAPALPVNTLALPALTTMARILPPLIASRHHRTVGPAVCERVKTPATLDPVASTATIRSARMFALIPHAPAPRRTPLMLGSRGKLLGARGEILAIFIFQIFYALDRAAPRALDPAPITWPLKGVRFLRPYAGFSSPCRQPRRTFSGAAPLGPRRSAAARRLLYPRP